MEVGEYVRTNDGFIRKIDKIEKCPVCEEKEYINEEIISGLHFQNIYHKKDIVNHSKNIIDLIEVGDYVNGYKVIDVTNYTFSTLEYGCNVHHKECVTIKSIVTKEQFQMNCYRLED